jgi:MFS transporter, OFA family, oxalate/formate antiporter
LRKERLKSHGIFFGWIVTFVSLCVTATAFGVLYSFGVFFKAWLQEWSTSRALLSGVFSTSFLTYGVASLVMGWLTDRYGPRKTLAAGGIIMGAGCFLTAMSNHVALVYLTWGIMVGIGVGTSYAPTASTVSKWFIHRKGLAMGIVVSGLGLGTLIFSPLSELLVESYGWRNAALILGAIIWIVFLSVALIIRRSPEEMGLKPLTLPGKECIEETSRPGRRATHFQDRTTHSLSLAEALKTKTMWRLFTIHGLWMVGVAISMAHLIPYVTDLGVKATTAATMLGTLGAMSIVGRLSLGVLTEHWGTRRSLVTMITLQACAMLWLMISNSPWMFWSFVLFFGFSYGGVASVWPLATAELFGLRSMGSIFGIILLGATIGASAGAPLAGLVFDKSGRYGAAFLGGALSMGTGVVLALRIKQPV